MSEPLPGVERRADHRTRPVGCIHHPHLDDPAGSRELDHADLLEHIERRGREVERAHDRDPPLRQRGSASGRRARLRFDTPKNDKTRTVEIDVATIVASPVYKTCALAMTSSRSWSRMKVGCLVGRGAARPAVTSSPDVRTTLIRRETLRVR